MLQDVTYADLKFGQSPPEGTRLEDLTYANVQAPSHSLQEPKGGERAPFPSPHPTPPNPTCVTSDLQPYGQGLDTVSRHSLWPKLQLEKDGAKRPPWLLAVGIAGIALVLLAALIALGVLYQKLQKASEEEKGRLALRLDRAMEVLNQTRESKAQREEVLNATWAQVATDWCPKDWVLYQGKCLFFSTEARNWERSQATCEAWSSRLLIAPSWLPGRLPGILKTNYFWIGLRKRDGQPWTWVDGSRYEGTYLSSYDICAYLNYGKLESYSCTTPFAYICEKTKEGTQPAAPLGRGP